jgi:Ser/Thr protein kinase RdoA (MazF antagonist)
MSSNEPYPSLLQMPIDRFLEQAGPRYGKDFRFCRMPHNGYRSTVLFLESDDGEFVLKVVSGLGVAGDVGRTVRLLNLLETTAIPVPATVSDADGQSVWEFGDLVVVLFERSPGGTIQRGDLCSLSDAGRILGQIHQLEITPDSPGTNLLACSDEFQAKGTSSQVELLTDDDDLCLVHGDFRGQNVLFEEGRVVCVLDWDDACFGPRLSDLAYGVIFFQAVLKDEAPSRVEMRSFLDGYQEVYPMSDRDWERFPVFLSAALARGLDLWKTVLAGAKTRLQRVRVQRWIDSFSPTQVEWQSLLPSGDR